MAETQFVTFAAAMAGAFGWTLWKHDSSRMTRAVGVTAILGAWIVYRAIEG
jgi:hypothetical protein